MVCKLQRWGLQSDDWKYPRQFPTHMPSHDVARVTLRLTSSCGEITHKNSIISRITQAGAVAAPESGGPHWPPSEWLSQAQQAASLSQTATSCRATCRNSHTGRHHASTSQTSNKQEHAPSDPAAPPPGAASGRAGEGRARHTWAGWAEAREAGEGFPSSPS
jgi:hypothetical protein